jgi:hypothetical protein
MVDPFPERGSGLLPISPGESGEDILFPFAMCLNTYFSTAWMQPLAGGGAVRALKRHSECSACASTA